MNTWYHVANKDEFIKALETKFREKIDTIKRRYDYDGPDRYPSLIQVLRIIDHGSFGKDEIVIAYVYETDTVKSL